MPLLHEFFNNSLVRKQLEKLPVTPNLLQNLRSGYGNRLYQLEAFKRFIFTWEESFDEKPPRPFHVLYNMATGSGKTLIMAGLVLYLYEQGYRNFLFFVHSNNIIKKTKDNFLNPSSSKYLFADKIVINNRLTCIKEVQSFEESEQDNINIKFTTTSQLHIDLLNPKENKITFEDLKQHKIVLIADESHHLNAMTKSQGKLYGSWEETVMQVHGLNLENLLIEFTATIDYDSREILKKYQSKVLFRYDLAQFRADKYSKEVSLLRSHFDEQERILQALILNLYREELAAKYYINLKPVILFKAKKTIEESERNKENFHNLINRLSEIEIEHLKKNSAVAIIQKAFTFFESMGISHFSIANRLKANFRAENCISANNDSEAELNQIKLNTLEDRNNPIRAVFAVHKLNEGWDVLNLFDIVRLYEGQNTGGSSKTIGATTMAEAQLIGRGARYFPFEINPSDDKFKRKYDNDPGNELKVLEELYYHTKEDSRYISELKKALIESGIYEDEDKLVTRQLTLKEDFKRTEFFQRGRVILNERIPANYSNVWSLSDLGVAKKNVTFSVSSGAGKLTHVFSNEAEVTATEEKTLELPLVKIPRHIVHHALNSAPFFAFNSIRKYFPNLESTSEFIASENYLGKLVINFKLPVERKSPLTNHEMMMGVLRLLKELQDNITSNTTDYTASEFKYKYVHEVFKDKPVRINPDDERFNGQEFLSNESWYVYNNNYGTSEEKAFVNMFAQRVERLQYKFVNIYLVRNERELKIYNEKGDAFEPDFLLFCKQKDGDQITFQVFIEPKGSHLISNDVWKQEFLNKVRDQNLIMQIDTDKYLITGLPFYNEENENEFKAALESTLKI